MKVLIDIPTIEFGEDIKNKFQDFFGMITTEITHRLFAHDDLICGNYEREAAHMFSKAFNNAIYIPDNATNGEQFLISHPDVEATILQKEGHLFQVVQLRKKKDTLPFAEVYIDWWNAPWKKEVE